MSLEDKNLPVESDKELTVGVNEIERTGQLSDYDLANDPHR